METIVKAFHLTKWDLYENSSSTHWKDDRTSMLNNSFGNVIDDGMHWLIWVHLPNSMSLIELFISTGIWFLKVHKTWKHGLYLPSAEGGGHMRSERGHRWHISRETQRQEEMCQQVTGGGREAFLHVCTIFSTSLHPALFYPQISSNEVMNMKAKNFKWLAHWNVNLKCQRSFSNMLCAHSAPRIYFPLLVSD